MDSRPSNLHVVETETRLTRLETDIRYMRDAVDGMQRDIGQLKVDLAQLVGELKAKKNNGTNGKAISAMQHAISALIGALAALVGVKINGG